MRDNISTSPERSAEKRSFSDKGMNRTWPALPNAAAARDRQGEALDHPLVQATLEAFPGATIAAVHQRAPPPVTDTDDIEGDVPQ